jgi:thiol-disulfide isomerase/thioredoxin
LVHANLLVQTSSKPGDKKLKEAKADIRQAIAMDPTQIVAHFNLGYVPLKQERDSEGIEELTTYVNSRGANQASLTEAQRMIANPIRAREPFAPDFSFPSLERQMVSNSSLRGKVVLLDFWGTWCPPCRESVPTLHNLQKKYAGRGFQLIGVSSDDDEEVWRTFVEAQKMDWTEYLDLSGEVLEAFKIDSFPTYVVLDKDGVMRFRQSGFGETTPGELEDAINKALKRAFRSKSGRSCRGE